MTTEACQATDFDKTFAELLLEMEQTSAEELQDAVYRRLEFRLCGVCQRDFLVNPLGKPRRARAGRN